MKLLLVLSSIFLVASGAETLYLKLKLNKVNAEIAETLLNVSHIIPGIAVANIPKQYRNMAPIVMKYLKDISTSQNYFPSSQTSEIVIYFPEVPAGLHDQVLPVVQSYTTNTQLIEVLTGLLPDYLKCGQCEFNGLEAGLDNSTSVPPLEPVWPGSIVGIQLIMNGTYKLMNSSMMDEISSRLPKLIDDELQKVLKDDELFLELLKDFVSIIDVAQTWHDGKPGKLKIRLTFPRVPSSFVELYRPLFDMYVVQNTKVANAVTYAVSTFLGCTGCSLESLKLINDKISSTINSKSPTALPTADGSNSASSLSVGFGLLMTIVAVAV